MLLGIPTLVAGADITAAAPAGASDDAARLRWHAPAGCPAEATVRARLAHALSPEVEVPYVDAEVLAGDDGRFHAMVVLRGSWGETTRSLDSPTCDTLADAVVLLAAVSASTAGEPEPPLAVPEPEPPEAGVERETGDEPAPGVAIASGVDPERSDAVELEAVPSIEPAPRDSGTTDRWRTGSAEASSRPLQPVLRGLARVEARAGAGLLPLVDLGAAATVGLEHPWFRVELGGAAWLPRERTVAPGAGVRASAWALELRGCVALRPTPRLVVLPCAELDAGQLRGEGRGDGLVNGREAQQVWVALGLGPALAVRLHRFVGLWAGVTLVVPVRRVGLGLEGLSTDAYRMAAVAGRGAVGLEVHFP